MATQFAMLAWHSIFKNVFYVFCRHRTYYFSSCSLLIVSFGKFSYYIFLQLIQPRCLHLVRQSLIVFPMFMKLWKCSQTAYVALIVLLIVSLGNRMIALTLSSMCFVHWRAIRVCSLSRLNLASFVVILSYINVHCVEQWPGCMSILCPVICG